MISMIVARNLKCVIGCDNGLPWDHIKEDMEHFKNYTMDKIVVMGSKTFFSIGKPLSKRTNVVLTHSKETASYLKSLAVERGWMDFYVIVNSKTLPVERMIQRIRSVLDNNKTICFIGGGQLYEQVLPHVDEVMLTTVLSNEDGDTHFYFDDPNANYLVSNLFENERIRVQRYLRLNPNQEKYLGIDLNIKGQFIQDKTL